MTLPPIEQNMKDEIQGFKNYLLRTTGIDATTFDLCLSYLNIEDFNKREHFLRIGEHANKIAYIHKGLFRIYSLKDGIEINTCFCTENSITSSFESFISQAPSNEAIQAIEDSTTVSISKQDLMRLYDLSPGWQAVGRFLTEKECLRLSHKATSMSFETATEKYQKLASEQPGIIQRVPIQDIASYIGVSRETLSRIRSKMAKE